MQRRSRPYGKGIGIVRNIYRLAAIVSLGLAFAPSALYAQAPCLHTTTALTRNSAALHITDGGCTKPIK